MKTSDFDYYLPPECIAQTPVEPRDLSRLLVLDRQSGAIGHAVFWDLGRYLIPGDCLVLNETRDSGAVVCAEAYRRQSGIRCSSTGRMLLSSDARTTWRPWSVEKD